MANKQDQYKHLEQLSQAGREIASALSIENIVGATFKNLSVMLEADLFSVGLHKPDMNSLEFPVTLKEGHLLQPVSVRLSDENELSAWCFNNAKEVFINNFRRESNKTQGILPAPKTGNQPGSVIFLPLWDKEEAIGVITVQSNNSNAYNEYHLNILRNLAIFIKMAIRKADAHWRVEGLIDELQSAQDKLIIQSKLADIGEIIAGIAHEIQNPLNFVNNFSELSSELLDEMREDLINGDISDADAILTDIKNNLQTICDQGKRADSIVKGMLQHSRGVPGQKEPTNLNALIDEYLRLAYHGYRAKDKSFNTSLHTGFDEAVDHINIVPQEIGRVILNLLTNAFYAVNEKRKLNIPDYLPVVSLSTKKLRGNVEIRIADNGNGIPKNVLDKIFQPFFSTKPSGEGTGLGLALSRDIVTKGHGGELKFETKENEGTTFIINLPVEGQYAAC